MSVSELTDQSSAASTPSAARFDIASYLKLLPKFNDKDPEHMEFARDLVMQSSRWCSASSVGSFEELCNLVVLEQFKHSLPSYIASYINDRKATTPNNAAVPADEYVLAQKCIFGGH